MALQEFLGVVLIVVEHSYMRRCVKNNVTAVVGQVQARNAAIEPECPFKIYWVAASAFRPEKEIIKSQLLLKRVMIIILHGGI